MHSNIKGVGSKNTHSCITTNSTETDIINTSIFSGQMETMKLAGRKWADDSEVLNCNTCAKAFSVTVRRHHCRNCGQIFCHDCSSKQAPLEANKKSVRVCDSCYNELTAKL